jgi:kinetochor protein Mis14/NSL1
VLLADMEAALGDGDVVGVEALEREDEVRRNWERAVEGLGRLDKGLPETRARLERAGEVVGYLGERK